MRRLRSQNVNHAEAAAYDNPQGAEKSFPLLLCGGDKRGFCIFPRWEPEGSILPGGQGQQEDSCIREDWAQVTVQLGVSDAF